MCVGFYFHFVFFICIAVYTLKFIDAKSLTLTSLTHSFIYSLECAESSNKYAHHISNRTITRQGLKYDIFPLSLLLFFFLACTACSYAIMYRALSSSHVLVVIVTIDMCVPIHSFYIYDRTMSKFNIYAYVLHSFSLFFFRLLTSSATKYILTRNKSKQACISCFGS